MLRTSRQTLSIVLAVVGAFFLVLGGFLLYARGAIFDSASFADRAEETLADERVQQALTVPIVNAIIDTGPAELINAQPIIEAGVGGVIDSSAFRGAFRDSVRAAHAALFEGDVERLVLTLGDAGVIAIEAVQSISPEIARDIPDDLEADLIEITDNTTLDVAPLTHDVRLFGIVFPLLGFVLLAGSVALAPVSRVGLIRAGAAVAVGSGIMLALYLIGRTSVLAQFADDLVHDAVAAGWDNLLGDLFVWYLALGAAAVIVASAAYAGVREIDPAAPLRRLATIASWRPARPAVRLIRAAMILAISLFLVLRPEAGLHIVVVAIGGWGLFVAVTELLLVVAPPPDPVTAGAGERATGFVRRLRPQRATAVLAGLAAVVLGIVLVTGGGEEDEVIRPAGEVSACNGYEELCDRTLDQVALAATHNSMSAAREHGWYVPNQRYAIPRQLEDGIRALLLDTRYGIESEGGTVVTDLTREEESLEELERTVGEEGVTRVERIRERLAGEADPDDSEVYLCHVACELGSTSLTEALTGVREFLDSHPDEFVVLFLEDPAVTPQDAARSFEESGILRYAYVHRRGEPFPTLRELIEADERLLVLGETQSGGTTLPWYHEGFELAQETPYNFTSEEEIAEPASCRRNRGTAHSPLFQMNNWVERFPRSPARAARVNEFQTLLHRARMCERRRGLLPTWIAVDHYDQGEIFGVVNVLNGLDRDADPRFRTSG